MRRGPDPIGFQPLALYLLLKCPELSLANIYSYLKIPTTLDGATLSGDRPNCPIPKSAGLNAIISDRDATISGV